QERPYHSDSTASRLLSEVKHCRARLVLRWGTTLESLVLFFCCSFCSKEVLVSWSLMDQASFLFLLTILLGIFDCGLTRTLSCIE
ncbi:hypothetical protein ACHAWT_005733, partial [Skeletonema menzelii]